MTRTFMWALGALALAAGSFVSARYFAPPAAGDPAIRAQLQALDADLQRLRGQLGQRERALGQQLPRLAAAAGTPARAADETPDEQDRRVELEGRQQELKLAAYYARLDQEIRLAPPAPARRAALQKNVDALAKLAGGAPLAVDGYHCAENLCRLEVRRLSKTAPGGITHAVRLLSDGMAELSMRPFDGDRSVIYAAPAAHKLPPVDL